MARASRFCHLCGRRLTGRYFRYENALVVCAACQARRPRCERCSVPLPEAAAEAAPASRLCASCARSVPRCACCGELIATTWYTFEDLVPASVPRHFCPRCVSEQPRCDLCRAPVSVASAPAVSGVLPDGQLRCALCATGMVLSSAEAERVYTAALAAFRRVLGGGAPGTVPQLTLVSRREMSVLRQRYDATVATEGPATSAVGGGHHVLGFFVQAHGESTIYAETGLPRPLLLGTLAHELGHAWQAERAPGLRDPLLCEGFAEWVAYRVLLGQGQETIAARALRREDIYGQGLRHYQWIERAGGVPGVLAAATGVGRPAR
jgi:hypothetical protein